MANPVSPQAISYQDVQAANAYFETIKGYARHEDSLLNNRVNWCLLFNSFLFTALALLTAQYTALSSAAPLSLPLVGQVTIYRVAVASVALTGLALTLSSALGVWAATQALKELNQRWDDNKGRFAHAELYPSMLGAGNATADRLGNAYPILLIVVLIGVWVVMLLAAYYAAL